ncbi:MAG: hypothetical protein ACRECY_12965, partial [Phyllobacterium sp.]
GRNSMATAIVETPRICCEVVFSIAMTFLGLTGRACPTGISPSSKKAISMPAQTNRFLGQI